MKDRGFKVVEMWECKVNKKDLCQKLKTKKEVVYDDGLRFFDFESLALKCCSNDNLNLRFLNRQVPFSYSMASSISIPEIINRQSSDPKDLINMFVEDLNILREDMVEYKKIILIAQQ